MPGGKFDKNNFYKNMEWLRLGPWMRCYGCGEINIGYMKCAGACNGKAFFCSKFYQKQSWLKYKKEHHRYRGDATQQDSAENEAMPDAVADEALRNDATVSDDMSNLAGASHLPRVPFGPAKKDITKKKKREQ